MARTHEFLSPGWLKAAKAVRDRHVGSAPAPPVPLRVNVVVTDAPFTDDVVLGHVDSSQGVLVVEEGHLDHPDLLISMDWQIARKLLVEQDLQAVGLAFAQRRIQIEGDLTKLLALQGLLTPGGPSVPAGVVETAQAIATELRAITA
jgi:hypothetical protein